MSAKLTANVGNQCKAAFSKSVGNSDCHNDGSDYSNRAEEFFQKLSRDTLLHKKLNSVSWLEEGEWRGFAILSRTLYLMTLGIKNERDEARALSAQHAEQLSNTMEVLCDTCKKRTSRLNFPENKENDLNIHTERSGSIESNPSSSCRNKCQKHIHYLNNDREALTELDNKLKSKKLSSSNNDSNANLSAHSAIPANPVILAPDTQMLAVSEQVPMPIDGHTSVPETMVLDASQPEDLVANEDSFNDSRDVFEDSDSANTANVPELSNNPDTRAFVKSENECTETITATHVSPVLGKAFGIKSSQSSGNSDLSPNRCGVAVCKLKSSRLSPKTNVLCKMRDKYLNDTTDSPISRIVNITLSPKCHSDADVASPQLLNLVPHRSTAIISQPIGSQVSPKDLKNRLAKECSSNINIVCVNLASSDENATNNNIQDKTTKHNDNLTEKLRSCRKISFIADDTKSFSNEANPENLKLLHESPPLNSNLKLKSISNKNSKKGPLDKIYANSKNSVIKYGSEINSTLQESVSETSATNTRTSRLSIGGRKSNVASDNQRSVSMHANVIPEKMHTRHTKSVIGEATSVSVSILKNNKNNVVFMSKPTKKNYKQTRLTSESFIVSNKKGNIEPDDPVIEVAKMKSLESKVIDDRRRLQLQHPALHQLHQQQQQHAWSSDLSPGTSLQNKKPSDGSSSRRLSDETSDCSKYYDGKARCLQLQTGTKEANKTVADHSKDVSSPKTKRKSNEACLHEDTSSHTVKSKRVRPCSSSESILTETQMMRAINDTASSSALTNGALADAATSADSSIKKDIALKDDVKTLVTAAASKTEAYILPTTEMNRMERRGFSTKEVNRQFILERANSSNVKNGEGTSKKPLKSNLDKVKDHLNDSFDRVPRVHCSPDYVHAAPVERGRAKRRQLPGWSCQQCRQYYEGRDMTEEQKKEAMNRCSKHRSKHKPITNTPKNYWKLDLSSSDTD